MSKEFDLIVFDWDGTLMDSESQIIHCMQDACKDLKLKVPGADEIRNIIGLGLKEAIDLLFPGQDAAFHQRLVEQYRHHFFTTHRDHADLFAGSAQTLKNLEEQGYMLAVATGKGRRGLDMSLEKTGLKELFLATRTADETFSKPHPRMLEEIMDVLGVEPHKTLMVGDSEYDMQLANNAGTAALAVSYGVHELPRLLQHGPRGHVNNICEVEHWISGEI